MGSWHGTCGISHLPIQRDDPIRVILLGIHPEPQQNWQTGHCGVDALAYPITPAIPAVYDDYGGAMFGDEAMADPAVVASFKGIKKFDMAALVDEGDLQEVLRAGPTTSFAGVQGPVKVGLWMAHEDVYQHLMTIMNADRVTWRKQPTWAEIREMAGDYAAQMAEASATISDAKGLFGAQMRFWHDDYSTERNVTIPSLGKLYRETSIEFRNGTRALINSTFTMLNSPHPAEAFLPYCRAVADLIRLGDAMETTRRLFIPQGCAGSTDVNHDAHRSLNDFVSAFAAKREAAWDEEYGEDAPLDSEAELS